MNFFPFHSKIKLNSEDLNLLHHYDTNENIFKKDVIEKNDDFLFSSKDNNNHRFDFTKFIIQKTVNIQLIPLDSQLKKGSFDNLENLKVENFSILTTKFIKFTPLKSNVNYKFNNNVVENFSKSKNLSSTIRNTFRFSTNINIDKKIETSSKSFTYVIEKQNEIELEMYRIVDRKLKRLMNSLINYISIK